MVEVIEIICAVIAAASILANITPNIRDNEFLEKLDRAVQLLAVNLRKNK